MNSTDSGRLQRSATTSLGSFKKAHGQATTMPKSKKNATDEKQPPPQPASRAAVVFN